MKYPLLKRILLDMQINALRTSPLVHRPLIAQPAHAVPRRSHNLRASTDNNSRLAISGLNRLSDKLLDARAGCVFADDGEA